MIKIQSEIAGKEATYGEIEGPFAKEGFILGGNWDFDNGYFDFEVEHEEIETIYVRIPVEVIDGRLDDGPARLRFGQPFMVRHVVGNGVATEDDPLSTVNPIPVRAFVNQFTTPAETDGEINNADERVQKAKQAISKILKYVH